MAARYFVGGGTGNWNSTTNWSTTSGGASGASVPTTTDDVYLDANSGINTLTVNVLSNCLSLTCTGFAGTFAGTSELRCYGNITLDAGMTNSYTGNLTLYGNCTLTSNGVVIDKLIPAFAAITLTLADDAYINTLTFNNSCTVEGGKKIYLTGNLTIITNNNVPLSYCEIEFTGSGNQTIQTQGACRINWLIKKTGGIVTFSNAFNIRQFMPSFIVDATNSATFVTTGTNLQVSATATFDVSPITWNNVQYLNAVNLILTSDLNIGGTLTVTQLVTASGGNVNIANGITYSSTGILTATSHYYLNGGTFQFTASGAFRPNLTCTGNVTFSGNIKYNTGILNTTAATITDTGSTLEIGASTTLEISGRTWNSINFTGTLSTYTINGLLQATTINLPNSNSTFAGTHGFTTSILTNTTITATRNYTLKAGNSYTVTSSVILNATSTTSRLTLLSSIAASYAIFTLSTGASCYMKWVNATDIDSSAGRLITSQYGVLLRTLNWQITNPDNFFFLLR